MKVVIKLNAADFGSKYFELKTELGHQGQKYGIIVAM